ncbi:MAG: rhodanese-like domain-containing protein [Burkholderiales bacterium]|nr:rhodanese-like domain-containing protein [Burkholderiales bacterium]
MAICYRRLTFSPLGKSRRKPEYTVFYKQIRSINMTNSSNAVLAVSAADSQAAIAHFSSSFRFETDCWDVHDALTSGQPGFVLLDVRSPAMYQAAHVPGAINLVRGKIVASRLAEYPAHTLFVTYCAGPHCNGAGKAALALAKLGRPVKIMIGGVTGWLDEGFALTTAGAVG